MSFYIHIAFKNPGLNESESNMRLPNSPFRKAEINFTAASSILGTSISVVPENVSCSTLLGRLFFK